jgi:hypothetical protein
VAPLLDGIGRGRSCRDDGCISSVSGELAQSQCSITVGGTSTKIRAKGPCRLRALTIKIDGDFTATCRLRELYGKHPHQPTSDDGHNLAQNRLTLAVALEALQD